MPFQRTGHIDTVALNYQGSPISPLSSSISRRYTANTISSASSCSNTQPKFPCGSYRCSTGNSSCDRPYRISVLSDSKRSSCKNNRSPTSSYSCHRSTLSPSPGRSTSSASFDLSKYSPHNYVPNIQRSGASTTSLSGSSTNLSSRSSSAAADLLGGDELSCERRKYQANESNLGSIYTLSKPPQSFSSGKTRSSTGISSRANLAAKESSSNVLSSGKSQLAGARGELCGLNGLRNIGNTCFMNSVIQCLSNTRPLLEYLLNEKYLGDINTTTSSMKGALIRAFSQVVKELWDVNSEHVVNTTMLKSQIQRFAPRFMGYSQQDAQEFLRYLLEGLHEDVNRVTTKPQTTLDDIPNSYSDSMKATESWKRYLQSEDSTIVDVFVGQLRSSLRCTVCNHESVTLDPFWDLSLPIPARQTSVKLSQCLEHFTREEILDGDERPTCSKCQMRRKCTKSFSIQRFPKILVIHLKRFSPMEQFRGKLNVLVDFPLTGLDLNAFAALRIPGCTYNLYGVANHSGSTHSGHYTAYCKHPYSGEWHEYNDSRVSPVPARSIVSSEAYVLFYEQEPYNSHL